VNLLGRNVDHQTPFFLLAGPCVVEPGSFLVDLAGTLRDITQRLGIFFVFKASYDKANRSSSKSYRGLGLEAGLKLLDEVKRQVGVPVITDVHENTPLDEVASVVDMLQTPAFLARQTDFIQAVAACKKPVNVKKGQFMAPWDMIQVVEKCREVGNSQILLCDRGTSFGYNTLISDMRGLAVMRKTGCPVVYDATHSVQQPGGQGTVSGGERQMVPVLARAAIGAGVSGLFIETHPDPDKAPSDGPNMWPTGRLEELLTMLVELDRVVKSRPYAETGML
jgi:2-dehydro-3-deoxyphosphooctonate aldolase (KDO 8-P synthase)